MSSVRVFGEDADDIRRALHAGAPADPTGPLTRALLRAEAELLAADAAAMAFGTYVERPARRRRLDALDLVVHRLEEPSRAA